MDGWLVIYAALKSCYYLYIMAILLYLNSIFYFYNHFHCKFYTVNCILRNKFRWLTCCVHCVQTYVEQLVEGKVKAGFVIGGSFGLHLLHSLFKDLLIAHVRLNQVFKAGHHCLCLLIELWQKERENVNVQVHKFK